MTITIKNLSYHRRQNLIIFIGMLILALVITLALYDSNRENFKYFAMSYVWALAICLTQWLGNSYFNGLLDKKYSWTKHLVKRTLYGTLAIIGYSVIAYLVVQAIMSFLYYGSLPENMLAWSLRTSYIAVLISFMVSLIFAAVGFFRNWKESLLEAERFRTEMLMYKYESLQNQINPHFLFNSFNVLSDLVYEDQGKAVDFIKQLSQLFRYVLDSRDRELVPIREELDFIRAYSYLLKTRFEEKLSIRVEVEAKEHELIVPMTLQLLVENCVKHNEISAAQPLRIQIVRNGGYLTVENNLQPKAAGEHSKKTGLSNIKQQYSYFTDQELIVSESGEKFSVKVPVIKMEQA